MTSYAINWVYLGQDGNDRIYYDTDSVSRQGNLVAVTMQEREMDDEVEEYNYLLTPTGKIHPCFQNRI